MSETEQVPQRLQCPRCKTTYFQEAAPYELETGCRAQVAVDEPVAVTCAHCRLPLFFRDGRWHTADAYVAKYKPVVLPKGAIS